MAIVGYVLICLVFGTTFLAIKIGLNEGAPPLFMAAIRFALAGIVLLPYLGIKKIKFPQTFKSYVEIAILGVLMTVVPFAALFWSEQYIPTGMASLLVATSPLFIGIFGKMDGYQKIGLIVSFIGIALVVFPDLTIDENLPSSIIAMLSIVFSECAFSYGVIRSKRMLAGDLSPQMFNAVQMIFGSVILFAISIATEHPSYMIWSTNFIYCILYLSLIASIIASGIYYWLVKVTNPMFPTTWTIVSPVIAVFAGVIFLKEPLTWLGTVGIVITLIGIIVVNRNILFLRKLT